MIRMLTAFMVGVDTKIDGNNAKWIVGAAAGFAKGDMNDRSGQVDQDSQTAHTSTLLLTSRTTSLLTVA